MDKEDLIFKSCNHDARGYPLLVSHLVNPHISFVAPLTFRFTRESCPKRLRRPVSLEDTSNHNGDTRNQRTTGRTVFNSPLQEESCRPAVRYHVKLLLPLLLLLADSKESKSLMADRRTLRDPGQNLYHHPRHRPNLRYSFLIHRC